ncbi:E3 SUMO-protein ligase ZNF451-like isoform X1 [Branchiostoma floridae x Branchiostoma belcheri]
MASNDNNSSVEERTAEEAVTVPPNPVDMDAASQADTRKPPNTLQSNGRQSSPTVPPSTDVNRNRVEASKADRSLSQAGSAVIGNLCSAEEVDVMDKDEDIVMIPQGQMEEEQDNHAVNKLGASEQTEEDLVILESGEEGEEKLSHMQEAEDDIISDQLKRDEELARQLQAEDENDLEAARRAQEEEDALLAAKLWERTNSGKEEEGEDVIGLSVSDHDNVVPVTDSDDDSVIVTQDMQMKRDEEMARQLQKQLERSDQDSDSDHDVQLVQEFEDSQLARDLSHQEASSFSTVTSDGRRMTALERMRVQVELNKREKEKQKANFKKRCSNQVAHGRQQVQQLQNTPERRAALQQAQSGLNQWMKYKAPWEKGHRKRNLMPRQTMDGPIPCPVINCAARFATPYMLTAHMETFCHSPCNPTLTLQLSESGGLDKYACVVCGKCFLGRTAHDHHVDMATRNPKLMHHWRLPGVPVLCFACPACGLCFGRSEECLAHIMERRHQHYPHIQPIPLTRNIYLQLTSKCEQVKFTVKCNMCRASFTRHSQIQRHYVTNGCNGSPIATAEKSILAVLKEMAPMSYCAECNIPFTSLQAASTHLQNTHSGTGRIMKLLQDNLALLFLTQGWQAETTGMNRKQTTWPWRRLAQPLKAVGSKITAAASSSAVSSPSAASACPNIPHNMQGSQVVRFPFPQASTSGVPKAPNSYPRPGSQAVPMGQLPFNQTVRFPLLPRSPASTGPQLNRRFLDMHSPGVNPAVRNQLTGNGTTGTKRCRSESGGDRSALVPPAQTFPSMTNKKKKKAKHQQMNSQTFVMSPENINAPGPVAKKTKHDNLSCFAQTTSGPSGVVTTGLGTTAPPASSSSSVPDPPEDVRHVIFVDFDNWAGFFSRLPQPLTDKTFVYGFKGGNSVWCPPRNNRAYDTIMSRKCFYLHPQCSNRKDAADFAICVHAGRLDERIPKCVPFTVLSGDGGFHELANQLQRSNRRTHIVSPHHQDVDIILATLNSIGET